MSPYLRWLSARFAEHAAPDVRFQTASRHVIGYAAGVSAEDLGPFVRSLRTWFDDEVTLVVDPDPEVSDLLDALDVRAFVFPRIIGWLPDLATSRLASFEHLLRQAGAGASVLLTDVRKLVFQGDPLSPVPTAIEPFTAEDGQLEGGAPPDTTWLDAGAGRRVAALLGQTSALCAGVVAGPAASLGRLCRTMLMQSAQPRSGAEALFQLNLTDADIQATPYRVAVVAPAAEPGCGSSTALS